MGKTKSSENCKIVYSLEFSAAKTRGALCRSSTVLCLLAQILTVVVCLAVHSISFFVVDTKEILKPYNNNYYRALGDTIHYFGGLQ